MGEPEETVVMRMPLPNEELENVGAKRKKQRKGNVNKERSEKTSASRAAEETPTKDVRLYNLQANARERTKRMNRTKVFLLFL